MYKKIVNNMNESNIRVWDEIYPCEYLGDDIKNGRLYILEEKEEIASAFALCNENEGEKSVKWNGSNVKALYIDRLGVNTGYLRKRIGTAALDEAVMLARKKGAEYLRLFVVDTNTPAINLYLKYGFEKVAGTYEEKIDEDLTLHEIGFELKLSLDSRALPQA